RPEPWQQMAVDDRLVALTRLRLAAAQRRQPLFCPHVEALLPSPGIDPVAPQQVGLDGAGKALGVDRALEAALALAPTVIAVADVPTDLARLRDPLLKSAMAAPHSTHADRTAQRPAGRPPPRRGRRRLAPPAVAPALHP